ncbi:MAG: glycosyltransferase family 2 protein [Candidatus Margulisiibacteriota bacterium]|jgi:GT2 family glycosyltransferase
MKQSKVSIIITTWNGRSYIENCLQSVLAQVGFSYLPESSDNLLDILIIDNNSGDGTVDFIKEQFGDKLKVVINKQNVGFSRGYNQGIHWTSGRYVLVLNQDVYLHKNFLIEGINFLDTYSKVGAVNPHIYRWQDNNQNLMVDSLGLEFNNIFQFHNISEGQIEEKNKTSEIKPVFGFTGTAVLLRRSALYDTAFDHQFFDEDFFSYKEDVDLSWRLRWRNWDIVYLPQMKAWHKRSVTNESNHLNDWGIIGQYRKKSNFVNLLSYRNHIFLLIKNLPLKLFFKYLLPILFYESKKVIYLLFTSPNILLAAWRDIFRQRNSLKAKRKFIMQNKKINSLSLLIWLK